MKALIVSVILVLGLGAQTPDPNEQMVTVPRTWVQPERQFQAQSQAQISHYIGIGKEIGEAVKNGLESVVDVSNKFANTPVGHFTMAMIAWKILGRDLLHVVIGIPLYIILLSVWVYFARRFYFGRWVKRYVDGKKQHVFEEPYKFDPMADGRSAATFIMCTTLLILNIACFCIIF